MPPDSDEPDAGEACHGRPAGQVGGTLCHACSQALVHPPGGIPSFAERARGQERAHSAEAYLVPGDAKGCETVDGGI